MRPSPVLKFSLQTPPGWSQGRLQPPPWKSERHVTGRVCAGEHVLPGAAELARLLAFPNPWPLLLEGLGLPSSRLPPASAPLRPRTCLLSRADCPGEPRLLEPMSWECHVSVLEVMSRPGGGREGTVQTVHSGA